MAEASGGDLNQDLALAGGSELELAHGNGLGVGVGTLIAGAFQDGAANGNRVRHIYLQTSGGVNAT